MKPTSTTVDQLKLDIENLFARPDIYVGRPTLQATTLDGGEGECLICALLPGGASSGQRLTIAGAMAHAATTALYNVLELDPWGRNIMMRVRPRFEAA